MLRFILCEHESEHIPDNEWKELERAKKNTIHSELRLQSANIRSRVVFRFAVYSTLSTTKRTFFWRLVLIPRKFFFFVFVCSHRFLVHFEFVFNLHLDYSGLLVEVWADSEQHLTSVITNRSFSVISFIFCFVLAVFVVAGAGHTRVFRFRTYRNRFNCFSCVLNFERQRFNDESFISTCCCSLFGQSDCSCQVS